MTTKEGGRRRPTRLVPLYLGIDPGADGAIAAVRVDGSLFSVCRLKETERDVWQWLEGVATQVSFAFLERVSSMPGQGVASSFKFGASFGMCRGFLVAAGVAFELVTPAKWQGKLSCRSGGDKRVTKARAQELFPSVTVTHATADAMLIAEYARRARLQS